MAHFSQYDPAALVLVDPVPGARSTSAAIWGAHGGPVRTFLAGPQDPMTSPWNPGAYPGSAQGGRATMTVFCPPPLRAWMEKLEERILEILQERADRYSPNPEVAMGTMWHSNLKELKNGQTGLRLKITLPPHAYEVNCWDTRRNKIPYPETLAGATVIPHVWVRHVWFSPGAIGLQLDVTDLMIVAAAPPGPLCPWSEAQEDEAVEQI